LAVFPDASEFDTETMQKIARELNLTETAFVHPATKSGVGEFLKQRKPGARIIGVEPAGAAILSGRPMGNHQIPGIGVGFVPEVLSVSVLNEVIAVTDEDAFALRDGWRARKESLRVFRPARLRTPH